MKTLLKALLLVVLGVGIATPVAASTFLSGEREVVIGAHDAVVSPTVSGYAELDFGPLLPRLRLPADAPADLGVNIRLGDADVSSLEQLVARDAIIASQPEGEIAAVRSAVMSIAVDAVLRSIGVGLLAVLLFVLSWRAAGPDRRREIAAQLRRPSRRLQLGAVATAVVTVAALALVGAPDRPRPDRTTWEPIRTVFPALPADDVLETLEVANGATTAGSRALVEGALATYRESLTFYGQLAINAATIDVRSAGDGETTALVVTD